MMQINIFVCCSFPDVPLVQPVFLVVSRLKHLSTSVALPLLHFPIHFDLRPLLALRLALLPTPLRPLPLDPLSVLVLHLCLALVPAQRLSERAVRLGRDVEVVEVRAARVAAAAVVRGGSTRVGRRSGRTLPRLVTSENGFPEVT